MKLRSSFIVVGAAVTAAIVVVGCNSVLGLDPGTLGNPNGDNDTGVATTDSGTSDSHPTDTGTDTAPVDSGIDSGIDSGVDTGHDTGSDTGKDTGAVIPEGGIAAAPIAGGVIAENSKYKIIMQTSQGGSKGPMTNGKYDLHGGTVTVIPK